jgi:hypothetical protein
MDHRHFNARNLLLLLLCLGSGAPHTKATEQIVDLFVTTYEAPITHGRNLALFWADERATRLKRNALSCSSSICHLAGPARPSGYGSLLRNL